jgi:hypothetical protein
MFKQTGIIALITLALILSGCGTNSNPSSGNINGNWTATLTDTNQTNVFTFNTALTESSNSSLVVANFTFVSPGPCFPGPTSETGSFGLTGNFNGNVTGTFAMMVTGNNNELALSGTVQGGKITGTWTLQGGIGCTGNGSFTMLPGLPPQVGG